MRELFVWYRVDARDAAAARAAASEMQRSLEAGIAGLQARLLIRGGAGTQTWMETYARPASGTSEDGGIDAAAEARIADAALVLRAWIEGERHVEAFDVARSS